MSKVVFPSFSGENYQPYEIRQLVSALELRFQSLEVAGESLFDTGDSSNLDSRYSILGHTHSESEISDLQAYLIDLTDESIFSLNDVTGTPNNSDILQWNSSLGTFEVVPASSTSIALNDLTNVTVPAPNDGDVLSFDTAAGVWEATATGSLSTSLLNLTDTDLVGQDQYDLLYNADGTEWQDTDGDLLWNPSLNYLQLANAHSINWKDSIGATTEMLQFEITRAVGVDIDPDIGSVVCLFVGEDADGATVTTDILGGHVATAVTVGGATVEVQTVQSKFGTGSMYFDVNAGATDGSFVIPDSDDFELGSGSFTFECHVRFQSLQNGYVVFSKRVFPNYSYAFTVGGTVTQMAMTGSTNGTNDVSVGAQSFSGGALSIDTWYHLAWVRDGTDFYYFLDGVQVGSTQTYSSTLFNGTSQIEIGNEENGNFNADFWLDNVRLTKGVARYTAGFTPPTAPYDDGGSETFLVGDPLFRTNIDGTLVGLKNAVGVNWEDAVGNDTELLQFGLSQAGGGESDPDIGLVSIILPFEEADGSSTTFDTSGRGHVGNSVLTGSGIAEVDTDQSKFGGGSLRISSSNFNKGTMQFPDSDDWLLGGGDFTIELHVRFATGGTVSGDLLSQWLHPQRSWKCVIAANGAQIGFGMSTTGSNLVSIFNQSFAGSMVTEVWYHLVWERFSGELSFYKDGVLTGASQTITNTPFDSNRPLEVGGSDDGNTGFWDGWLDNVRITIGTARYGGAFTPPAAPFPDSGIESFVVGDPAFNTQIDGTAVSITADTSISGTLNVDGDSTLVGALDVTGIADFNANVELNTGATLTIWDSTDTDNIIFSHDGTDFNQVFTNTRTWAISALALSAATGNELAMTLDYTVNKATSGDDTGLRINKTDTLSQGTSLLLDLQTDGVTKFSWSANPAFTIYDNSGTDSAAFNHDGTDFLTTFVNTGDWLVTGLAGGEMNIDGSLTVQQDFTVSGTLTSINTSDLNIADNIILLNSGETGTPSLNAGIEIERGTSLNVLIRWNETNDRWEFTNDGTTFFDVVSAHTGEVTGEVDLTVDITSITNRSDVVADSADDVAIHDDSDGTFKKVNLSSITDAGYF